MLLLAEAIQGLLALAEEEPGAADKLGEVTTAKAWAVQHILNSCQKRKEKLVFFCQYLTDLDELELIFQEVLGSNPVPALTDDACLQCSVVQCMSQPCLCSGVIHSFISFTIDVG